MIRLLQQELAAYKVAAEKASPEQSGGVVDRGRKSLPTWKKAAKVTMAIAPSSAAAVRVFFLIVGSLQRTASAGSGGPVRVHPHAPI